MTFRVIGYENAKHYTDPDKRIDFAVYDNEDIGFTATLAADDAYEFALPYPADVDLDTQALQIHWIDFIAQRSDLLDVNADSTISGVDILMSMLDFDFNSTNPANNLDDTNSLEIKKAFDGPYAWDITKRLVEHSDGTPASTVLAELTASLASSLGDQMVRYVPPHVLDLPLPLFVAFVNRSKGVNEGGLDTAATEASFAINENIAVRIWYTSRSLTAQEKAVRGQAKWMRLGA